MKSTSKARSIQGWIRVVLLAALAQAMAALPVDAAPARGERGQRGGQGQVSPQDREAVRADMAGPVDMASVNVPPGVKFIPDIVYREGDEKWKLDLAMPEEPGDAPRPAIVFIHGGGWRGGDKRSGYFLEGAFDYAQKGYVCVSVNYRLAQERPPMVCIEDVRTAVRWLRANAREYNLDPDRIGGYGNSAGAHLAAMLALATAVDPALDKDSPYQEFSSALQAICASATPTNFLTQMGGRARSEEEQAGAEQSEESDKTPEDLEREELSRKASPVNYARADAPPILLIHGDIDGTVNINQATELYDKLKEAGAGDVTLMVIHDIGHGVFQQKRDVTHPAMERFFERTLMNPESRETAQTAAPEVPAAQAAPAPEEAPAAAPQQGRGRGGQRRGGAAPGGPAESPEPQAAADQAAPNEEQEAPAQGRAQSEPQWVKEPITAENLEYHTFHSATIDGEVSYLIYLPPGYKENESKRYPTMYWLHGRGGAQSGLPAFCRRMTTAIEAGKCPEMLVVFVNGLPSGGYTDSPDGQWPVESVTIKDLIPHIDATYRTIPTREGRVVEGFSMGGGGAAKWGFKYPELFAGIGVMAGALQSRSGDNERDAEYIASRFGTEENYRQNNTMALTERNADQVRAKSTIRIVVGSEDGLVTACTAYHEKLAELNIDHDFRVIEGARHSHAPLYDALGDDNWAFYREAFAEAIASAADEG